MTVDDSPVSPAASSGPPKPKAKTAVVSVNNATPQSPGQMTVNCAAASPQGQQLPPQSPQQQQLQSPMLVHQSAATGEILDPNSFEAFAQMNSAKAEELMGKLVEVTGMTDRLVLFKALNQSKKTSTDRDFNIAHAIEWILQLADTSLLSSAPRRTTTPSFPSTSTAGSTNATQTTMPTTPGFSPIQPPNSPTTSSGGRIMRSNNSVKLNNKPLVDLTESPSTTKETVDADLEKAIKLSLQEAQGGGGGGAVAGPSFGVSQEEQDVSRALEASLLENQIGGKRSRGVIDYIDPLNPHDRERNGMWPVGLKNVGQTCWFSAVIQSLFYLPAFRSLVLNFPPPSGHCDTKNEDEKLALEQQYGGGDRRKKIVEFMLELRKLFALMVASQRKYVDPTRAVDILRGSIGTLQQNKDLINIETNNQQDVSEFTHIVLEWVEEAFKQDSNKEFDNMMMDCEKENNEEKEASGGLASNNADKKSDNDVSENPMSRLFYGKVLTEGSIHGDAFVREEAFGQWPLQVNTFTNIHESLENSTAHESLDAPPLSSTDPQQQQPLSGQERWFLRLPPVLFLELSRFHYNKERKTPEKIHNRLDFPERIFMDRYVADKKQITRQKREEVRALKEKRALLKTRLDKFTNYGEEGSNTPKMPLPGILQSTLNFAMGFAKMSGANAAAAASNLMQVDSPCGSPKVTPASSYSNLAAAAALSNKGDRPFLNQSIGGEDANMPMDIEMSPEKDNAGCDSNESKAMSPSQVADPSPRHVSDSELRVLQNCLLRWKEEVEQDIRGLESAIQGIDGQIENMYSDESLQKLEYQLHAVMVHEGSIDSGHYWAYVLDHKRKVWLKFNDNTVNEASWEELAKESMGGHSNTSAYSLVYIDTSKPELLLDAEWAGSIGETREEKMEQGELEALAITLPQDLAQFVIDDNNAFHDEVIRWDKEQETLKRQDAMATQQEAEQNAVSSATDTNNDVQVVEEKLTYVNNHAKLSLDLTVKAINSVEKAIKDKGAQNAVLVALERVINHYCSSKNTGVGLSAIDGGPPKTELLPKTDIRLESFVYYLLRNDETKNMPLVEMAVLEQFSFPGLDNNTTVHRVFRTAADNLLSQRRAKHPHDAATLRQWHQAYHLFRRSVHCFVSALEAQLLNKYDEALDLYTEAFNYTMKANEVSVAGGAKSLKSAMIVRYLCKVLPEVNHSLIGQFRLGESLNEVIAGVQSLVVPVLAILQNRVSRAQSNLVGQTYHGVDAQTLEEVRNDWCALLGETDASTEAASVIQDVLPMILELDVSSSTSNVQTSKNRESVDQMADMNLNTHYVEVLSRLSSRPPPAASSNHLQPLQPLTNANLNNQQHTLQQLEP